MIRSAVLLAVLAAFPLSHTAHAAPDLSTVSERSGFQATGRYDEARGTRKSAYQGRYEVEGNRIQYWDDTGFTADGTFVTADELHHGGMVFYRETGE